MVTVNPRQPFSSHLHVVLLYLYTFKTYILLFYSHFRGKAEIGF